MRLWTILLVGGAFAAAVPAAAQTTADWNGFSIGGRVSYDFMGNAKGTPIQFDNNLDGRFGDTVTTAAGANAFSPGFCNGAARGPTPASRCRPNKHGLGWAVQAGYDVQAAGSPLVFGIAADFGSTDAEERASAFSTTPAFYTIERRMKYQASVRARAGYAFGDGLFYVTGGPAWAHIKNSFSTSNTANSFSDNGSENGWGYRVGGGIEHKITPNISVGVLYLYTDVKSGDYRVRAGNSGTTPAANPFIRTNAAGTDFRLSDRKFDTHSAGLTANFRF